MTAITVALVGWLPISQIFYWMMSVRRATLVTIVGGWLILPVSGFRLPGIPDYDKFMAVGLSALIGIAIHGRREPSMWRLSVWDSAILLWCVSPFITSLTNDLGVWDGVSNLSGNVVWFGVPYYVGRRMFSSRGGIQSLAAAFVVGALFYSLPAMWEARMSPRLNLDIYGFTPMKFHMSVRLGGYRPVVFLNHGLELGLFMCVAALAAVWLWRPGRLGPLLRLKMAWTAPYLLLVAVLCRALNGWTALITGLGVLGIAKLTKSRLPILLLALLPAGYVYARTVNRWDATEIAAVVEKIDTARAFSLASRLEGEERMLDKLEARPFFGWGDWERNRVEVGRGSRARYLAVDSMWIIEISKKGAVGVSALILVLCLPLLLGGLTLNGRDFTSREHSSFAVCAIVPVLFLIDGLANYMLSPLYLLCAGAATGYVTDLRNKRKKEASLGAAPAHWRVGPRGSAER